MAKWAGKVGFEITMETEPGVWEETIVERRYYGDANRTTRRLESSGGVNDNINISNEISFVADPYANQNFHTIRYAEYMGTKWKVSNIDVQYPRLILTLGGVYNGEQTGSSE